MRSNWGRPPAPQWAAILFVAMCTCASTGASNQIYFIWDRSKGKSSVTDHHFVYKCYYNLVCVVMRSNWGRPPAPQWAALLCVAMCTCSSTGASDQIYFIWDRRKGKSSGSDHPLVYKRYCNLVCVVMRSNWGWPPAPQWATILCVAMCTCGASGDQIYFVWDSSKGKSSD